jgi:C-terminal processing protease CtpA/Prc
VPSLVLDLRGNEGGADEVGAELLGYIVPRTVTIPASRTLLRYERVAADLLPYLDTWDRSFFDVTRRARPAGDGFYALEGEGGAVTLKPNGRGYAGKVYLLVDAGNSSATFLLARLLKQERLATLVGQETGGNLRGTNGGWIAFLRLPRSRIEVDVPLKGYFPMEAQPDGGLTPDAVVPVSVEDVARGVDPELEAARRLIAGGALP